MGYVALGMKANGSKCSVNVIDGFVRRPYNLAGLDICYPRSAPPDMSGSEEG